MPWGRVVGMPRAEETLTRTAYDAVADTYADRFTATEPEQPVDLAMIDHFAGLLTEPRRVLDAGCGAGRLLPYLAAQGCRPQGVDLSRWCAGLDLTTLSTRAPWGA